jgi:hypothetical protein
MCSRTALDSDLTNRLWALPIYNSKKSLNTEIIYINGYEMFWKKLPEFLFVNSLCKTHLNSLVLYRVHKIRQLDRSLNQFNPVNLLICYFIKIRFNTRLPFAATFSNWSLFIRVSGWNSVCIYHLSHACYLSSLSRIPRFHYPNNIWRRVRLWSSSLCNFLRLSFAFSPLRTNRAVIAQSV